MHLAMDGLNGFWSTAQAVTSLMVSLSALAAAVVAVIKFRVLHMFRRRYRSELQCRHHALRNGRVIFEADYTIQNTGERPITVSSVRLRLHPAIREGVLLVPDRETVLAERVLEATDPDKKGLLQIESGERSICTLRCELAELPGVVFVHCQSSWPDRRDLAPYIGMYVPAEVTAASAV
jgi:hypothetical protein